MFYFIYYYQIHLQHWAQMVQLIQQLQGPGFVNMDVNYALDEDEVEEGYILTCQSHPTSDKVVIDFDEI